MKSILTFSICLLLSISALAQGTKTSYLGDYYLYGWLHNNINFNTLKVVDPFASVHSVKINTASFGSIGLGVRIRQNEYLTLELGRYNTRFDFEAENDYLGYRNYVVGTPTAPGFRIGYGKVYKLWKFQMIPNIGIHSFMMNFNGNIPEPIMLPIFADLKGDHNFLFGPSLGFSMDYVFMKRWAVFANIQANYVINSNRIHELRAYNSDPINGEQNQFFITTNPLTINYGLGIRVSMEHKSYFQKK